jgi:hypothetical protein
MRHAPAAQRTLHAGILDKRLGVLAFRETRAGKEAPEPAGPDNHLSSAFLADLVGLLDRQRHLDNVLLRGAHAFLNGG